MKHLLSIFLTSILCATAASAQTIKSLGYNTTNGQVVANTTNALHFTNDNIAFNSGDLRLTNGALMWGSDPRWSPEDNSFDSPLVFNGTNTAAATRANLGFSTNLNTFWAATNAAQARQQISAAASTIQTEVADEAMMLVDDDGATPRLSYGSLYGSGWTISDATGFRSAINMPLSALTNTSNVTMMRALSGSTNTNHPYSGSISVVGTNNTNTLVFSNGVLQSVQ